MKKLIGYCRVSTERQRSARNGLEAQREEIENFAKTHGYEIVEIVEEGVSGKYDLDYRPVLKAAIQKCLKTKATLVCSKLDRLSRRASFIMNLMETKLKFVVAELGEDVSPFMIHVHCIVSEHERHTIGARTKAALHAKKQREPNWNAGNPTNFTDAQARGNEILKDMADTFAQGVAPIIEGLSASGMSLNAIAKHLNHNKVKTRRGGAWTAQSISNLRARLKAVQVVSA